MCKCEKCGKEGSFFSNKECWYYFPGPVGHTICDKCLSIVLEKNSSKIIKEKINNG